MAENTADTIIRAVEKFSFPLFTILALTSGTVSFWPSGTTLFRLNKIPNWITNYAGLAFIVSAAILFFLLLRLVYTIIIKYKNQYFYEKQIRLYLDNMNNEEKAILREFVMYNSAVISLPYQDNSVMSLRNKGIIFLATTSALVRGIEMDFPHQLPSKIRRLIDSRMIDLEDVEKVLKTYNQNSEEFQKTRPHFRQPRGYY